MTALAHPFALDASFCTFTGIEFFPFAPRAEDVSIYDIAHALARQCRYGGHVASEHFSVAEHCVLVSSVVPPEDALWGLLHDSDEAYLPDLPTPIKRLFPEYKAAGDHLRAVILRRFGLPPHEPASVREADQRIRLTEQRALFKNRPRATPARAPSRACRQLEVVPHDLAPYAAVPIVGLPPALAERAFLERFHQLTPVPR
jgi:5'-deoxynucleotidase YfbR-like HD superfamily hydrolase